MTYGSSAAGGEAAHPSRAVPPEVTLPQRSPGHGSASRLKWRRTRVVCSSSSCSHTRSNGAPSSVVASAYSPRARPRWLVGSSSRRAFNDSHAHEARRHRGSRCHPHRTRPGPVRHASRPPLRGPDQRRVAVDALVTLRVLATLRAVKAPRSGAPPPAGSVRAVCKSSTFLVLTVAVALHPPSVVRRTVRCASRRRPATWRGVRLPLTPGERARRDEHARHPRTGRRRSGWNRCRRATG